MPMITECEKSGRLNNDEEILFQAKAIWILSKQNNIWIGGNQII